MKRISRRHFLYAGAAFCLNPVPVRGFQLFDKAANRPGPENIAGTIFKGDAPKKPWKWSCEGSHYTKIFDNQVVCGLCPHKCVLAPGDRSVCRSRVNINGVLYSLVYGNPCAVNIDPVEKKPLFHFRPKTSVFSIATTGCNFRCLNCQNWELSQSKPREVRHMELFPEEAVSDAVKSGSKSIAYTYSEAITFFEYMLATSRTARRHNINNLLISNGYINKKPLLELSTVLDAANINLKAFDDSVYRRLNGGTLQPVLETCKTLSKANVHLEITNLVVPGYVDDDEMVKKMCGWIIKNLGPDHPLHFLRFFPKYKLDRLPPTPVGTLTRFRELAMKEGIRYVYIGNVPGHEGANTYCHNCSKLLIKREGYSIPVYNLTGNVCRYCDTKIPGVWDKKI